MHCTQIDWESFRVNKCKRWRCIIFYYWNIFSDNNDINLVQFQNVAQLEERKESSASSTLEKISPKSSETVDAETIAESEFKIDRTKAATVVDETSQVVDEKSSHGENDESAVKYIQVHLG